MMPWLIGLGVAMMALGVNISATTSSHKLLSVLALKLELVVHHDT